MFALNGRAFFVLCLLGVQLIISLAIPTDHRKHYAEGGTKHNVDYDHEAFLGSKDEADEFDQLTPEETKTRLTKIIERIDSDHNGNVTESELKTWIFKSQHRYIDEDVLKQWNSHTDNNQQAKVITWESFKAKTYGFLEQAHKQPEDLKTYHNMLSRDERRWHVADIDQDGALNKDEFLAFLHPEEVPRMHAIVVEETLEDIDRNKDGKISLSEYIADLYAPDETQLANVPEWVNREKEQFVEYHDKDKDGYLNRDEIRDWILPANFDHSEAEAKHLIFEADGNKDGVLTKDEILDNYSVFVGSQVTDFGEGLTRHDEF